MSDHTDHGTVTMWTEGPVTYKRWQCRHCATASVMQRSAIKQLDGIGSLWLAPADDRWPLVLGNLRPG